MWSGKVMRYAMQPGEEAEKRRPAGGGGAWRGGEAMTILFFSA